MGKFNHNKAQDTVAQLSYKNFEFFLQPELNHFHSFYHLAYIVKVEDNFAPKNLVPVGGSAPLYSDNKEHIIERAWRLVVEYETHEAGEKFWVGKELPKNPHRKELIK